LSVVGWLIACPIVRRRNDDTVAGRDRRAEGPHLLRYRLPIFVRVVEGGIVQIIACRTVEIEATGAQRSQSLTSVDGSYALSWIA